jgi:hypothetical protein
MLVHDSAWLASVSHESSMTFSSQQAQTNGHRQKGDHFRRRKAGGRRLETQKHKTGSDTYVLHLIYN